MEKYSSGERANRRRWRSKEGERVAAVAEREQIAFAKGNAVTATGSKRRDSKTNRPRHTLFLKTLAAPGFYGIEAQKMQTVALQFSIKIPTTK